MRRAVENSVSQTGGGTLSGEDFLYHSSMNIGEAKLPSLIAEGKTLMIDSQQVKDGGVEVENMNGITSNGMSEFVGSSVHVTCPATSASHPHAVSVLVMIATSLGLPGAVTHCSLCHRCSSEFGAPYDEGFVQKTFFPQIPDESRDGFVDLPGLAGKAIEHTSVMVPTLIEKLDKANPALHQSSREEAIIRKGGFARLRAIHLVYLLRLAGNIH